MQLESEVALSIVMYNEIVFTALSALAARWFARLLLNAFGSALRTELS